MVTEFLRAGRPPGMPATGYSPLVALMPRRVSEEEMAAVAARLAVTATSPITLTDLGVAMMTVLEELPTPDEIDRLRRRLVAHGWVIA